MYVGMYVCMNVRTYACMYICMIVCMYVCACIYIYICMYRFMYICMNVCMYACMYICMIVCMYVCACIYIYICMYRCMYRCMNVCMHACMYVCVYMYARIRIYARMYTHLYVLYCIVFIHFYSASHSLSLSEALPTTAIATVSEFTRRSATGNCARQYSFEFNFSPRTNKDHPYIYILYIYNVTLPNHIKWPG